MNSRVRCFFCSQPKLSRWRPPVQLSYQASQRRVACLKHKTIKQRAERHQIRPPAPCMSPCSCAVGHSLPPAGFTYSSLWPAGQVLGVGGQKGLYNNTDTTKTMEDCADPQQRTAPLCIFPCLQACRFHRGLGSGSSNCKMQSDGDACPHSLLPHSLPGSCVRLPALAKLEATKHCLLSYHSVNRRTMSACNQ